MTERIYILRLSHGQVAFLRVWGHTRNLDVVPFAQAAQCDRMLYISARTPSGNAPKSSVPTHSSVSSPVDAGDLDTAHLRIDRDDVAVAGTFGETLSTPMGSRF